MRRRYEHCPLCGSKGEEVFTKKVGPRGKLPTDLTWMRCTSCGHSYTKHYWTPEGLKEVFSYTHKEQVFGGDLDNQRYMWGSVIARAQVLGLNGPIVDLGCGNGALVATADEHGIKSVGIDAREAPVQMLRQMGYVAHRQSTEDADLSDAGMVALADVLEHLPFPRDILRSIRGKVKAGTLLFVSCPNRDCMTWRAMNALDQNIYWTEIEHHHNFSRDGLYALLQEESFKPVHYGVSPRWKACMEVFARAV